MRNLIGIAFYGEIGAGKTTASKYLVEHRAANKVAFADALRREAAYIISELTGDFAMYDSYLKRMQTPKQKEEFRDLLRWLGPWRRSYDPQYWIRRLEETVEGIVASHSGDGIPPLIVADDTRYDNERDLLLSRGFVFVLVNRVGLDRSHDMHDSEMDWRKWTPDHILFNSGTLEEFHSGVEVLFGNIRSDG